jgi:hypothetical protein
VHATNITIADCDSKTFVTINNVVSHHQCTTSIESGSDRVVYFFDPGTGVAPQKISLFIRADLSASRSGSPWIHFLISVVWLGFSVCGMI